MWTADSDVSPFGDGLVAFYVEFYLFFPYGITVLKLFEWQAELHWLVCRFHRDWIYPVFRIGMIRQ